MTKSTTDPLVGIDEAPAEVVSASEDVRRAAADLRAAVSRLEDDEHEALQRYSSDVDLALARMNSDLDLAAARLRADTAESSEELHEALEQARSTWRSVADDLKVQAHLAQMEVRDAAGRAGEQFEEAGGQVLSVLETLRRDAAGPLAELRARTIEALRELRDAITGIDLAMRPEPDETDDSERDR